MGFMSSTPKPMPRDNKRKGDSVDKAYRERKRLRMQTRIAGNTKNDQTLGSS
jgi:hypothetical protein